MTDRELAARHLERLADSAANGYVRVAADTLRRTAALLRFADLVPPRPAPTTRPLGVPREPRVLPFRRAAVVNNSTPTDPIALPCEQTPNGAA